MARNFGKIETAFWTNPKMKRLSDDAQKLFLYLCTSKHSTGASAYGLPIGYVTEDLGWANDRVAKSFHELALKPHVLRDPQTNIVFVTGWWEHNQPENPRVAAYLTKQLLALPDCALKVQAIEGLKATGYRHAAVIEALGNWTPGTRQENLPLGLANPDQRSLLPEEPQKPAAAPKPKTQGTRLPEDWRAPAEYRDYASKKNLTNERIDQIEVRFVRYWTGPDATDPVKKDWFRTWCNWIDKDLERKTANGNGAHHASSDQNLGVVGPDWSAREDAYYRTKKEKGKGFWLDSWDEPPDHPNYRHKKRRVPPPPT